jgi:hypothetical protein
VVAFLDPLTAAYAKLMSADLGFSEAVYGFRQGISSSDTSPANSMCFDCGEARRPGDVFDNSGRLGLVRCHRGPGQGLTSFVTRFSWVLLKQVSPWAVVYLVSSGIVPALWPDSLWRRQSLFRLGSISTILRIHWLGVASWRWLFVLEALLSFLGSLPSLLWLTAQSRRHGSARWANG